MRAIARPKPATAPNSTTQITINVSNMRMSPNYTRADRRVNLVVVAVFAALTRALELFRILIPAAVRGAIAMNVRHGGGPRVEGAIISLWAEAQT
jgi:hypothetical protein